MRGFRCDECGLVDAEGNLKIVVQDRTDCSFGEVGICPVCESEDIESCEFLSDEEDIPTDKS